MASNSLQDIERQEGNPRRGHPRLNHVRVTGSDKECQRNKLLVGRLLSEKSKGKVSKMLSQAVKDEARVFEMQKAFGLRTSRSLLLKDLDSCFKCLSRILKK